MCGFVGIRRFDGAAVDPGLLRALADLLTHRGPDGAGVWTGDGVGLAHRRLAIIDPQGSPQPLTAADGRTHVAFNGEILNYRELRRTLRYPFATDGDTEVLLALHRERGPVGVEELRGQFAYALHDETDGTTWLVRDRLGILPLYYVQTPDFVAFASEAKALLPVVPGGARVDDDALDAYLQRRAVPAPATLFRGVRKLPPGCIARIGPDGRMQVEAYWTLPEVGDTLPVSDGEAVELVAAALDDAVTDNLVADVPVGAYLSGGLDSSLIAALAANRGGGAPLATFSAGFDDPRVDELPHARAVSHHLGTDHTEVTVTADRFAADWQRLTWHRDAPLSEPADLAVHQLALAASERVKVVLSGEGSDELFGGYPKHRLAALSVAAGAVPLSMRRFAASHVHHLPGRARRAAVAGRALSGRTSTERLDSWFSPFTAAERAALLGRPVAPPPPDAPGGDPLRRMLAADAGPWLADNLLERGDRMTMAASVELRPPFLDHRLVELAFRLPSSVKVRRGAGKWVVKEVARPLLPPGIVDRPKAGFRVPLDRWFRGDLRDLAWDHLSDPQSFVGSVFEPTEVRRLLERHGTGSADEAIRIWTLLSLEIWHGACVADAGNTRTTRTGARP